MDISSLRTPDDGRSRAQTPPQQQQQQQSAKTPTRQGRKPASTSATSQPQAGPSPLAQVTAAGEPSTATLDDGRGKEQGRGRSDGQGQGQGQEESAANPLDNLAD